MAAGWRILGTSRVASMDGFSTDVWPKKSCCPLSLSMIKLLADFCSLDQIWDKNMGNPTMSWWLGSVTNRLTCVHKSTWFQCWHPHNWLFQSDQPIHVHPFLLGFEDKSWQNAKVESTCRSNRSVGSLRV